MTQIGIMIEGQDGLTWERWGRLLQAAEDFGYQCLFRSDHYTNASPPDKDSLELWTSLTYAAISTRRIEFGPLVAPVPIVALTLSVPLTPRFTPPVPPVMPVTPSTEPTVRLPALL